MMTSNRRFKRYLNMGLLLIDERCFFSDGFSRAFGIFQQESEVLR
jgi:hypothetical protein